MDAKLEARVREMLDKQEIHEVLMRYCRGVDRGEADLVTASYHPDAVDDRGAMAVVGRDTGAKFTGSKAMTKTRQAGGQHFTGNVLIELEGDKAYVESYFISFAATEKDDGEYTRMRGARYLDRFERRGGAWKIAYRVVADEWDRLDKLVEASPGWNTWIRGNVREKDPWATFKSGATRDKEQDLRKKLGV